MAFFWVCNNSFTRQSRAGIIRMTQSFYGIAFRKWHLRWEILIRKTCSGTTLLNETPIVVLSLVAWMNADFNTLKEQRFNWLSHQPEFSTSRIMRTLSKMPKKSENQKKIKDNGSNLPLWLFVGVDEVRVHTSKQVEANSKLWSHVKWESSFFLLCLLKRRNTRVFGDHLGIIFLNVFEKSSNICFHAPHNRTDLAHRPCAG